MAFNYLEFLQHYEQYPCLWDKSIADFKNRQKRDAAEEKLLPVSGLSNIKQLRAKIRSIRGTYNQEVRKIERSMRTGAADVYTPKLNWFSYADSFLRKNLKQEIESESNLDEINADEALEMVIEEDKVNEQTQGQEQNVQIPVHTVRKQKVLRKQKKSNNSKLSKKHNSLDDAVRALREVSSYDVSSSNNEFNIFGQLVATQLAQLPLDVAITLQQEFQTKINDARLQHIRDCSNATSPSTTCLSSNSSERSYQPVPHEVTLTVEQQPSIHNYYSNWDHHPNA